MIVGVRWWIGCWVVGCCSGFCFGRLFVVDLIVLRYFSICCIGVLVVFVWVWFGLV